MAVTVQFATGLRVSYLCADRFQAVDGGWGKVLIAERNPCSPITIALVPPACPCIVELVDDPTVRVEMVPHIPMTAKGE